MKTACEIEANKDGNIDSGICLTENLSDGQYYPSNKQSKHITFTIHNIIKMGPMLRAEILPLLGVLETVKICCLSKKFNQSVDYNNHNPNGIQKDYLSKILSRESRNT